MIKKLDADVATRIAAGEVIERPSSVAKELIENAIDASARNMNIYIEQGGKTSFVIEDDGVGISCEELPLALERYATSKISSLDDLERISTLGYRGEALASVAAVSRLEIRSRTADSETGGIIRCEGGMVTLHTDNPCRPGTRIQVDDLFYNLPARRKFLKTASAELRRIIQIVNDYALIHPEITIRVFSDGKKLLEHTRTENISEALAKRWGSDGEKYFSGSALGSNRIRLWWNPIPDARRVAMTVFVNGRRIQDPTIRAAVCGGDSAAYGEWLIILDMPPDQLDVNIHPTKEEVRFRRSQEIFKLVYDNAQNVFSKRFSIHQNPWAGSQFGPRRLETDSGMLQPDFDRTAPLFSQVPWRPVTKQEWDRTASHAETVFTQAEKGIGDKNITSDRNYIGQTASGFLLFDFPQGLAVMDPHAAHERILFEEISSSFKDSILTQTLAVPVEIPAALLPEIRVSIGELGKLGFTVDGAMLTGVPLLRGKGHISPLDMLRSAMRGIEVEHDPAKRDMEVWWRLARLACRDAVKLGQKMEREEAMALLQRLERCGTPYTCPHGRPTLFILENRRLEEWFER